MALGNFVRAFSSRRQGGMQPAAARGRDGGMRAGQEVSVPFEDFVRARSAALFRTALLLTGQHRAEAEDLLQGALERAYRHWGRISRSGDPERYVRRILANASTDRWRQLRRRPEQSLPADPGGPAAGDHAADVAVPDPDMDLHSTNELRNPSIAGDWSPPTPPGCRRS